MTSPTENARSYDRKVALPQVAARMIEEARTRMRSFRDSLSGRLLILTIAFVMLSEVLVYIPSVARARIMYLDERLQGAHIAVLAMQASESGMVTIDLERQLLGNAGVDSVSLKQSEVRVLYLANEPRSVDVVYDLRNATFLSAISDAFGTMLAEPGRIIRVIDDAPMNPNATIEIVLPEQNLRTSMFTYSRNILLLSILIAVLTATLVYLSLSIFLVRPMKRITANMVAFRENPKDATRVFQPTDRRDEIGIAQRELAAMQADLRSSLQQTARLAALGTAVSKINHDLRNILASAQLVSDRLRESEDPLVKRLAPKLLDAVDRAVNLCTNTLRYGKVEERTPAIRPIVLADLVRDVAATAGISEEGPIGLALDMPGDFVVQGDVEHLFRVLLNLVRNAAQALMTMPDGAERRIIVRAERQPSEVAIFVSDTGPGIPDRARPKLFEAFSSANRPGGTGLGLSIARELVEAHGGTIAIARSDPSGTEFVILLPQVSAGERVAGGLFGQQPARESVSRSPS